MRSAKREGEGEGGEILLILRIVQTRHAAWTQPAVLVCVFGNESGQSLLLLCSLHLSS